MELLKASTDQELELGALCHPSLQEGGGGEEIFHSREDMLQVELWEGGREGRRGREGGREGGRERRMYVHVCVWLSVSFVVGETRVSHLCDRLP